jgi:hypothetical protein
MVLEIMEVINQIDTLLPQFSGFIDQFNTLVIQKSLNVVSDSSGNMAIDVPYEMSNKEADNISKRINIIDRLIDSHHTSIKDLFDKGFNIEKRLKAENPNYISELVNKKAEFNKLKNSYLHIR